ncbi:hypothetical protein [[Eubacterium] cellulosolvens]
MNYWAGMFLGFLLGVTMSILVWGAHRELNAPPIEKDYEAYRVCIKKHDCVMTPTDYINYYRIKWRLDEAHRKESGQDE